MVHSRSDCLPLAETCGGSGADIDEPTRSESGRECIVYVYLVEVPRLHCLGLRLRLREQPRGTCQSGLNAALITQS